MNKRIYVLDIVRSFSCLSVLLYHYTTRYDMSVGHLKPYNLNIQYGYMAVSTFFILSGFLTMLNVKKEENYMNFIIKKCIRIYPVYWVCIIITTIFMSFLLPDRVLSVKEILLNMTLLSQFIGVKSVDGAYWTLKVELIFYLIMACLIMTRTRSHIKVISFTWIMICIILNLFNSFFNGKIFIILNILFIGDYSQAFIIGIMMAVLVTNRKQMSCHLIIGLCILNHYILYGTFYTIFLCFITLIFYGISYEWKIFKIERVPKIIIFISTISYPVYLLHQFIGFGIIKHLELKGFVGEIYLIIPILIIFILAYLINKYIEKPMIKWSKKVLKNS